MGNIQSARETSQPALANNAAPAAPTPAARTSIATQDSFRSSKPASADGHFTTGRALGFFAKGFVLAPVLDIWDLGKAVVHAASRGDAPAAATLVLSTGGLVALGAFAASAPLLMGGLAAVGLAMGGIRMARGFKEVQALRASGENDRAEERCEEIGRGAFGVATSAFMAFRAFGMRRQLSVTDPEAAALGNKVDQASRAVARGKPAPVGDQQAMMSKFEPGNQYFNEVMAQARPEQRAQIATALQERLSARGYTVDEGRYRLVDKVADLLPRKHMHPSGGSSYVDGESRSSLAHLIVSQGERTQAGARLGSLADFDALNARVSNGLAQALKNKDFPAFQRMMQAIRPDMKPDGIQYFYQQGYTIGGVANTTKFAFDGLIQGLVGGSQQLLSNISRAFF